MPAGGGGHIAYPLIQLSGNVSEYAKHLALITLGCFRDVIDYLRESGLKHLLNDKFKMLSDLTTLRILHQGEKFNSRFKNKESKGETEEDIRVDQKLKRVASRISQLSQRVEAMQQRLSINSSIVSSQKGNQSPSGRLPLGIGQTLDNSLMSGDMSVDEYVMQLSRLHESFQDSF